MDIEENFYLQRKKKLSNCLPKLSFIPITAGFMAFRSSGKARRLKSLPSKHYSSLLYVLIPFNRELGSLVPLAKCV